MSLSKKEMIHLYQDMLLCRELERKMASETPGWHGAAGEEGVIVGAFFGLEKNDYICPHFRGHYSAQYVKGLSLEKTIGNIYARANAPVKGKGIGMVGSMKDGIIPLPCGPLGTIFLIAMGVALAAKIKKEGAVVVETFGDGESARGEFHEAMNFAAVKKLPIVYVCGNNKYGMFTRTERALAQPDIFERASGYNIPGVQIDGNDVLAVNETVQWAVGRARRGEGPSLIECKTYRLAGHTSGDPAPYKSKEEEEAWLKLDPIKRFTEYLIEKGVLTEQSAKEYSLEAKAKFEQAFKEVVTEGARARRDREYLLSGVYAP
ncbi:MAG: thiamine pyrophosphate-dependent dehydrogenase E1 component subunit alpha [Chloroflexota bacterium]